MSWDLKLLWRQTVKKVQVKLLLISAQVCEHCGNPTV